MRLQYESERLRIECLTSEYAPYICEFYKENAPYFDKYELTRPNNFYTPEFHTAMSDWEWKEMQAFRCLRYYLLSKQNPGIIIGTVNVSNIRMGGLKKASIGYKIDHRYWNRGYATEACNVVLNIVFQEYGLHRLEAEILPSNTPSVHVIEKLGFIYEGIEHEAAEVNGKWEDLLLYAKLNPYRKS